MTTENEVGTEKSSSSQAILLPTAARKPFKDITLTANILEERCYVVHDSVLRIYVQLSEPPPLGWAFMFKSVWEAAEYDGKVPAGAEGDAVWVDCEPEEMRDLHYPALAAVVDHTNKCFRPSYQEKAAAQQRKTQLDSQARVRLRVLRLSLAPQPTEESAPAKQVKRGFPGSLMTAMAAACAAFKKSLR